MASGIMRHQGTSPLADLFDWFDSGFPPALRAMGHTVRVEDYEKDGRYVLRAELPGVDPEKDVEITVSGGMLTVRGERREEQIDKHRSEFRYGSFERHVPLPEGIDESDVRAEYTDGVLSVSFPLGTRGAEPRRVPVQRPDKG